VRRNGEPTPRTPSGVKRRRATAVQSDSSMVATRTCAPWSDVVGSTKPCVVEEFEPGAPRGLFGAPEVPFGDAR
jgi:hypothetical protein